MSNYQQPPLPVPKERSAFWVGLDSDGCIVLTIGYTGGDITSKALTDSDAEMLAKMLLVAVARNDEDAEE